MLETKGPFRVSEETIKDMCEVYGETRVGLVYTRGDAERITACLNFCEGLTTAEMQVSMEFDPPRTALHTLSVMNDVLAQAMPQLEQYRELLRKVEAIAPLVAKAVMDSFGPPPDFKQ